MTLYEANPIGAIIIFGILAALMIGCFHSVCKICLPPGDSWTDFYKFVLKLEWLRKDKDA